MIGNGPWSVWIQDQVATLLTTLERIAEALERIADQGDEQLAAIADQDNEEQ